MQLSLKVLSVHRVQLVLQELTAQQALRVQQVLLVLPDLQALMVQMGMMVLMALTVLTVQQQPFRLARLRLALQAVTPQLPILELAMQQF